MTDWTPSFDPEHQRRADEAGIKVDLERSYRDFLVGIMGEEKAREAHERGLVSRGVFNADRLDRAAQALLKAAGRPDTPWLSLTAYEREAWREAARQTISAYLTRALDV